ncbi:MAG: trypsin-like peptidase domain-containing protein [Anaerolineae bacterium]
MPRPFRLALLAGVVLMLALAVAPHTAAAPAAACTYVVHEGDTLDTIAARFNTSPSDLAAVNGIEDPQSLQPGVTLVIPDCPNAPAPQARTNRATPARSRLQIDTLDTHPDAKDIAQPLVDRAVGATVHIVAETRYGFTSGGTGTVVGADGRTFLTAFHVVGDPTTGRLYPVREIRVGPFKDWTLRAHVIATDPENDLAALIVNEDPDFKGFAFAPLGDSDTLQLGDTVYTLSYPGAAHGGLATTRGVLLGKLGLSSEAGPRFLLTDAEASPGSSGGVAINEKGEVIGIVSAIVTRRETLDGLGLPQVDNATVLIPINWSRPLLAP